MMIATGSVQRPGVHSHTRRSQNIKMTVRKASTLGRPVPSVYWPPASLPLVRVSTNRWARTCAEASPAAAFAAMPETQRRLARAATAGARAQAAAEALASSRQASTASWRCGTSL